MNKILYKGIDVSNHNGIIDWNKINKNEIQFVIIRAGYGTYTQDPRFKANIEGAIKTGLHIGVYWFSYAGSTSLAQQEALKCLNVIKPYMKHIDLPVFFDFEDDSFNYVEREFGFTPNKTFISALAVAFMEQIKTSGLQTGIYSNPNYLTNYINDDIKNKYDVWLAHVLANGKPLLQSSYKGKYTIHQYSWVGKVQGIQGNVDMNNCYKDYFKTNNNTIVNNTNKKEYLVDYKEEQASQIKSYNFAAQGNLFLSPHFQVKEFRSKDKNNLIKIDNKLIWILERLFTDLKCSKMIINSGYRTPEYSVKVGGHANDRHTKGQAADIVCYDKNNKVIPAKTVCIKLTDYGDVFGVGYISANATHVDSRPKTAIWYGDETNGKSLIKLGYTNFDEYFNLKKLKVKSGTWNVRSAPNTVGKVLTIVRGGETYFYSNIQRNWAYIPSLKGWLSGSGYTKI